MTTITFSIDSELLGAMKTDMKKYKFSSRSEFLRSLIREHHIGQRNNHEYKDYRYNGFDNDWDYLMSSEANKKTLLKSLDNIKKGKKLRQIKIHDDDSGFTIIK